MAYNTPSPSHPCTWFLPGEWTAGVATRQAFHLFALLDCATPSCSQVSQPGLSGLGKNVELNTWQMCLGSRGLSFFCWFAVSLTVLFCPGPLIISYPVTLWGLEVCEFSLEHMTKLSEPSSVRDPRASLQKGLSKMASVAGDGRNRSQESISQEVTDNDRCCKVLMSTSILAVEVQLA